MVFRVLLGFGIAVLGWHIVGHAFTGQWSFDFSWPLLLWGTLGFLTMSFGNELMKYKDGE